MGMLQGNILAKVRKKPDPSSYPRRLGSPSRSTKEWLKEVRQILDECGCDPLAGMAQIAIGDVVKLGYMTEEEVSQKAVYCKRTGVCLRKSGRERALEYLPPQLRFHAYKEIAQYAYSKRLAVAHSNPDGSALSPMVASVVVQLPPNGR